MQDRSMPSILLVCACTLIMLAGSASGGEAVPLGKRPRLVIVMAEQEYHTDQTLPAFAKRNLADRFQIRLLFANPEDRNDIPGLESLADADLVLLSVRRRVLPTAQMDRVRAYIASGKPLVGIRTACHAFCLRKEEPPAGHDQWPDFDRKILGCFYHDHFGTELAATVQVVDRAIHDPILAGVRRKKFPVRGSLYRCAPLNSSARLLLVGRVPGQTDAEPVAWTNVSPAGGRVFYTSLGHPGDFQIVEFAQLLRNGIYWAAGLPIPTTTAGTVTVTTGE